MGEDQTKRRHPFRLDIGARAVRDDDDLDGAFDRKVAHFESKKQRGVGAGSGLTCPECGDRVANPGPCWFCEDDTQPVRPEHWHETCHGRAE